MEVISILFFLPAQNLLLFLGYKDTLYKSYYLKTKFQLPTFFNKFFFFSIPRDYNISNIIIFSFIISVNRIGETHFVPAIMPNYKTSKCRITSRLFIIFHIWVISRRFKRKFKYYRIFFLFNFHKFDAD